VGVRFALAVAVCAACVAPAALAQKSTADGLRDCEKLAAIKFKRDNPAFRRFAIDRAEVEEDKFTDKVGTQFVSTVYHGKASLQDNGEAQNVRFICLHAGVGKGAVFVYTLPLN
jgi:hypothetical protein